MGRLCTTIMLLAAGSLPAVAQRLDGCVDHAAPGAHGASHGVSYEERDLVLRGFGYSLTQESLLRALADQRPDVRSLAALKLAMEVGRKAELAPIMQAWLAEEDLCTKAGMGAALSWLVGGLAWDAAQHPGGQWRVTPFQTCTPSDPALVSLTIEKATEARTPGPAVRISVRSQMPQTLAFVKAPYPSDLFSVSITAPTGEPVKVKKGLEWMYEPEKPGSRPIMVNFARYLFQPLPPSEDVSWIWKIGDDFEMSVPGIYRVSFGGTIGYLDTTVCSNTLWLTVE
jgi:hypothetical protein